MLLMQYHAEVRRRIRRGYADMNAGRIDKLVALFDQDAVFQMCGDHAFGGVLRGRETIARWFLRTRSLMPTLEITPLQIVVSGPPWTTHVAARFWIDGLLIDGSLYHNEGIQFMRLVWGSIVDDRLYEDTSILKEALALYAVPPLYPEPDRFARPYTARLPAR
jgi:ketosteroid isomerase-like protein